MAAKSNLTPAQAAAVLNVSPSTLRRWSADFGEHLSPEARGADRKHRSYTTDDIATLKRASELLKTHAPAEVTNLLGLADETQQSAALATLPTVAADLANMRALILQLRSEVAALHQANQDQAGEIGELKADLANTRGEVARALDRQHTQRKALEAELTDMRAQLADLQARRSWWQRFTRK